MAAREEVDERREEVFIPQLLQGLRGQVGDWGKQQWQLARRLMRGGKRRPDLRYRG